MNPEGRQMKYLLICAIILAAIAFSLTAATADAGKTGGETPTASNATSSGTEPDLSFPPRQWKAKTGMVFTMIPAGKFQMGSDGKGKYIYPNELPLHWVIITEPFLMGRLEVTVREFEQFTAATGYITTAESNGALVWSSGKWVWKQDANWKSPYFRQTPEHPASCISYADTQAFIAWMNENDDTLPAGWEFSLPSEAQWEYAARGTDRREYPWGRKMASLCGNFADATSPFPWKNPLYNDGNEYTAPTGSLSPGGDSSNGICDMSGNVWEWCREKYNDWYYYNCPLRNPEYGGVSADFVLRGGSWAMDALNCRCVTRGKYLPGSLRNDIGFRLVVTKKLSEAGNFPSRKK